MLNRFPLACMACSLLLLGACSKTPAPPQTSGEMARAEPESASGFIPKPGWTADNFMVSAANPLATEAGVQMLRDGGSAVDATIAVQMVLTLVEPQSSGIGGGAFLLHFDGKRVQAYDGRETAPALVDEHLFRDDSGKTLTFHEAVVSGRSVGVPGVLRMLELAHQQHGKLPWATLFAPAIRLAEQGFEVSPRLAALLRSERFLKTDPAAANYFYDAQGRPLQTGHMLKNPQLAQVLREIASKGADAFYEGPIAADIAAKVAAHPLRPGALTVADLAAYQAKERDPLCTDYRQWTVCGMPPPSSGGIAVAQMLGILRHHDIGRFPPKDGMPAPEAVHLFSEAGRLAYADRARYVADTDFVPFPGNSVEPLLDKDYLAKRARLIDEQSMGLASAGNPFSDAAARGLDTSPELPATSHMSIVDVHGNAASMTTTIENAFGSRQMVRGFLLNNQLTDFSFNPVNADGPVANRVQPGKRPRSAMAPTLVFDKGTQEMVLAIGSPGGSAIINYVAKVLIGVMDWNLNVQQAINLPNFGSRNGPTELEQGRVTRNLVDALKERGHNIRIMKQTSGLQGVMRLERKGEDAWFGGADPRREGVAQGG
jgi:gamma-glutamyltranspeptidase/glutathione hydrolase